LTYAYDATTQLLAERRSGPGALANTFTYDALGNRLLKQAGSQRTTMLYDAANQIRYSVDATGRTTYTYDANGNQQAVQAPSGARTTYVWDFENQNTRVR